MLDNKIKLIRVNIQAARDHIAEIEGAMSLLEQAGMYPAIPHFQWQTRNGDGQYLYLLFRQNHDGTYAGPDGKRKVYIGANEKHVEAARQLARNRQTWEQLKAEKLTLFTYITVCEGKLLNLEREADRTLDYSQKWPRAILPQIETAGHVAEQTKRPQIAA